MSHASPAGSPSNKVPACTSIHSKEKEKREREKTKSQQHPKLHSTSLPDWLPASPPRSSSNPPICSKRESSNPPILHHSPLLCAPSSLRRTPSAHYGVARSRLRSERASDQHCTLHRSTRCARKSRDEGLLRRSPGVAAPLL